MIRSLTSSAVATALFVLGATSAQSAVVVSNDPDQVFGTNMSFALVADDFSLASSSDVTGLRFWTLQSAAADYAGSVYWAIYSGGTGPTTLLQSGNASAAAVATGNTSGFGYAEYVYDISVAFTLSAGTYWLALQNDDLGNTDATEMIWGTSGTGGASGQYRDFSLSPTPDWLDTGLNHAFAILAADGSTPASAPGTLALLAAGWAAAAVVRRQRQPA